jgi:hypothetical protein
VGGGFVRRTIVALLLLLLVGISAVVLSGCATIDPGEPVTEEFDATGVREVVLSAPGDLVIVRGTAETLVMDTGENIAEDIAVTVDDGVMEISVAGQLNVRGPIDLDLQLEVPNIERTTLTGSGSIEGEGFAASEFVIDSSGSGSIRLSQLDCTSLDSTLDGSGEIVVAGVAEELSVDIGGSGSFDGEDLQADSVVVVVDGSGSATVWAERELDAEVNGSGSIEYYGEPRVSNASASGSGSIEGLGTK